MGLRDFLFSLPLLLFLSVVAVALPAEESWYLITESELQSIENYKTASQADKQTLLSRVIALQGEAKGLQADSQTLNGQLTAERQTTSNLRQSFSEYEAEKSQEISQKNTKLALQEAEISRIKKQNRWLIISWVIAGALFVGGVVLKAMKLLPF